MGLFINIARAAYQIETKANIKPPQLRIPASSTHIQTLPTLQTIPNHHSDVELTPYKKIPKDIISLSSQARRSAKPASPTHCKTSAYHHPNPKDRSQRDRYRKARPHSRTSTNLFRTWRPRCRRPTHRRRRRLRRRCCCSSTGPKTSAETSRDRRG